MSKTTADYMKKICGNAFYESNSHDVDNQSYLYFEKRTFSQDPKCQNILNTAFDQLEVSGVLYNWHNDGQSSDFCDNDKKEMKDVAFVAVNVPITKASTEFIMNGSCQGCPSPS